jgi:hypothetical protein
MFFSNFPAFFMNANKFEIRMSIKLRTNLIHKVKQKGTTSHSKICSSMNTSHIIIYLNN